MHPSRSSTSAATGARPAKLFLYASRTTLERALQFGEFRLLPPAAPSAHEIRPFASRVGHAFLTLSMTSCWDEKLFDAIPGADTCLVVHDPEQFGERVHRAAQRLLPSWAGIDAAVSYGAPSPLGQVFSKPRHLASEREWLFAWRPAQPALLNTAVMISIGNIESIAELRERPSSPPR
ncbi:MAG TPA: hypothetical protein VEC01_05520 [Noviherbaspirillum sp.]|uniref:hypothetical protein n=1 Tax=Noviherbaspirillum sp. TaxID=1926288 RepID=UPI002D2DFB79|nr:hypothetical protein [Noviherbaspirillum sp.]HYD94765.1 hypothetical protein [Noviherbaspirillum sp.]